MKDRLSEKINMLNGLMDRVGLVSEDEVLNILNAASHSPARPSRKMPKWKIIAGAASTAGIAAAVAAIVMFSGTDKTEAPAQIEVATAQTEFATPQTKLPPRDNTEIKKRYRLPGSHKIVQLTKSSIDTNARPSEAYDSSKCQAVSQWDYSTLRNEYTRLSEKYSHFALIPAESIVDEYSSMAFDKEMNRKIEFFEKNDYDQSTINDVRLYACVAKRYSETVAGLYRLELNESELTPLGVHLANDSVYCNIEELISDINYNVCDANSFAPFLAEIGYDTTSLPMLQKRKLTIFLNGKTLNSTGNCSCATDEKSSEIKHDQQKVVPCSANENNGISPVRYDIYYGSNSNTTSGFINSQTPNETKLTMSVSDEQSDAAMPDYSANPMLGKLIPVDLVFGKKHKYKNGNSLSVRKITFWYVPDEKFLSRIPERYRSGLRRELEILKSVESNMVCLEDACRSYSSPDSFFDLCRISSGAISFVNLYPNPCSGRSTVVYKTTESRNIRISLHNQNGALVRRIDNVFSEEAGEYEQCIDVHGLESGTYLLAITTGHGEQIVQRLTVVK